MENFDYRLKIRDIIPIKGLIDYGKRNKDSPEFREIDKRYFPLMAYNVILIGTFIAGLEKILN